LNLIGISSIGMLRAVRGRKKVLGKKGAKEVKISD
jgi:hypothetical protein